MWQAPNRPNNQISQTYNDGIISIYTVTDTATAGYAPIETLSEQPIAVLRYEEQRLGVTRYYQARQNQMEIDRVVRVQKSGLVNTQCIAIDEKGVPYRIDLVQIVQDVYPPSEDLTLYKVEQIGGGY